MTVSADTLWVAATEATAGEVALTPADTAVQSTERLEHDALLGTKPERVKIHVSNAQVALVHVDGLFRDGKKLDKVRRIEVGDAAPQ